MEGLKNKIREVISEANELGKIIHKNKIEIQDGKLIVTPQVKANLEKMEEVQNRKHNYIEELKEVLEEFERLEKK